ncbi:MAG: hypothetical protein AAFX05_08205 [Planctomycetota bacterium]
MSTPLFDTAIVPDFSSPERTLRFEGQTLFFLASWHEHAGAARSWPVHLACVGEPPASIRALAEKVGARITVHGGHESKLGRLGNKLCAWDVETETDQLLFLDSDTLCFGDPSEILRPYVGAAAGAPAGLPRVLWEQWERIDAALGLPEPKRRMVCAFTAAGIPLSVKERFAGKDEQGRAMWPLINGGLLFVPRNTPFDTLWVEHWDRIAEIFDESEPCWHDVVFCDMTAMATALRQLEHEGLFDFKELPPTMNCRWMQLVGGQVGLKDVSLYHAVNFFRKPTAGPDWLDAGIAAYETSMRKNVKNWSQGALFKNFRPDIAAAMNLRAARIRPQILAEIQRLADVHVREAVQA